MNIRLFTIASALAIIGTPLCAMNESKALERPLKLCPGLKRYVPSICWLTRTEESYQELLPVEIHQHILKDLLYLHVFEIFLDDLDELVRRDYHNLLQSIRKFEQICTPDTLTKILKICLSRPDASLGQVHMDHGHPTILHTACEHGFLNEIKIIVDAGGDKLPGLILSRDNQGRSSFQYAVMHSRNEIIKLFINTIKKYNSDLWALFTTGFFGGDTVLHATAVNRHSQEILAIIIPVVRDLGRLKEFVFMTDEYRRTAKECALESTNLCYGTSADYYQRLCQNIELLQALENECKENL